MRENRDFILRVITKDIPGGFELWNDLNITETNGSGTDGANLKK